MRYKNPELQDRLASEYALGCMTILVRKRFECLMEVDAELYKKVCQWEQRLYPLYDNLLPEKPVPQVWESIDKQLMESRPTRDNKPEGLWSNLLFLRSLSSVALAITIGLLVMLQQFDINPEKIDTIDSINRSASYVAVMLDKDNKPSMVINTYKKPLQLSVNLLNDVKVTNDKKLYLWAITKETREVHPLGELSTDDYSIRNLTKDEWKFLKYSRELFITEESLDFQNLIPTGKIHYKGICSVFKPKRVTK